MVSNGLDKIISTCFQNLSIFVKLLFELQFENIGLWMTRIKNDDVLSFANSGFETFSVLEQ